MKKLFIIAIVVGGLLWAKKHYIDKPTVHIPTKEEIIAEKIGRAAASGALTVRSQPQPIVTGTDSAGAAATTTIDEKQVSGLLATIQNMLQKQQAATTPEQKAKARVERFMASWKEGGLSLNDAAQAAACQWSRGVAFIPSTDEIADAANGFYHWRKEKDLYVEIESYSVGEATRRIDRERGDYTEVDVMINRATYRLGVPDKANPIFWTF
ncbi:MAG: hypothetical protein QOE82_2127 [Thermoanaerobaculia bacterium]|jgi:hypothetical protein|nr:hypothetical protein [Thermoanaerobaculia bacterium]